MKILINLLYNSCIYRKKAVTLQPKVAKLMSKTLKDRLDYLIALVSEFAATHHLSLQHDVEHTLSFDQAVEDITMYCKRMGGSIA